MYKSKNQIKDKIKTLKFEFNFIYRNKNRLVINDGIDKETGANVLSSHIISFFIIARTILQFAYKEAKNTNNQNKYDEYINQKKIFKIIKMIRNTNIHDWQTGIKTVIYLESKIDRKDPYKSFEQRIEKNKKLPKIERILFGTTSENENNKEKCKELITFIEKTDIHEIIEEALKEIELFVNYGIKIGFIT